LAATSLAEPDADQVMKIVQRLEREPDLKRLMSVLV
jgi:hypothetical protein